MHLGSLLTALAGFLQARSRGGAWLLRIDDLDEPRCPRGMDGKILRQLEAHGLWWDEAPRYQTRHVAEYEAALARLEQSGRLYYCSCTRATLKRTSIAGPDGPVYAATCRTRHATTGALRFRVLAGRVCLDDAWQQDPCRASESEIGDFVVRRADGQVAYQLASVVDEQAQRISEVVRGSDLLGSSFQQRCLHDALGLAAPAYRHLPVLVDERGLKLSKQNHAPAVDPGSAPANLLACLTLLRQQPPAELSHGARASDIIAWATEYWDAAKLPRSAQIGGTVAYNALQQSNSRAP